MKKKGFTLIELMIVLAVIAILAVVLVPKAGQAKDNAKGAGIATNVNSVRAFLETKTGPNFIDTAANLQPKMNSAFQALATGETSNLIVNPFSNLTRIDTGTTAPSDKPAVWVVDSGTTVTPATGLTGTIIVVVNKTAGTYTVYGIDNTPAALSSVTISK